MAVSDFFSQYAPYAQSVSRTTGIDPRIVLAQAALETGYGQSAPNFNLFGIKGKGATLQTKEFVNGGLIDMPQEFRTYESPEESFLDYAKLMGGKRYEGVRSGKTLEEQVAALQKSGYATDPDYGKKIMQIAKGINLEGLPMNGNMTQQVGAPLSTEKPEKSGGLLGSLLGNRGSISGSILGGLGMDEDQADRFRMAILAGTGDARMAPLIQATQARMQERKALRDVNKTVDWLRQNVSEEVAQAVANNPGIASNVMSSVLAQRLKPTDAGFRVATPEEAAQYGAQAGQFDAEGRFYPTQKVEMTQEVGGKSKFTEAGQTQLAKDFGEMAAAGRDATSNLGKIRLLGDLLEEAGTGITAGFASRANQLFGVDFRTNAAAAAEALISQLVPAQRPPGSGTISDADLALYKASLPSISGTPGGNKLIIQSMVAITEHNQKVGRIASKVLTDPNYSISQAEDDIAALPDPFAGVRSFFGSAPAGGAEEPLTREGAMDVLKDAGIIDG
jgi:hypothetical protein